MALLQPNTTEKIMCPTQPCQQRPHRKPRRPHLWSCRAAAQNAKGAGNPIPVTGNAPRRPWSQRRADGHLDFQPTWQQQEVTPPPLKWPSGDLGLSLLSSRDKTTLLQCHWKPGGSCNPPSPTAVHTSWVSVEAEERIWSSIPIGQ